MSRKIILRQYCPMCRQLANLLPTINYYWNLHTGVNLSCLVVNLPLAFTTDYRKGIFPAFLYKTYTLSHVWIPSMRIGWQIIFFKIYFWTIYESTKGFRLWGSSKPTQWHPIANKVISSFSCSANIKILTRAWRTHSAKSTELSRFPLSL